jgi:chromosome segregation ATPase
MNLKGELRQELESLEAEYRYWLVETIRMDRSIDTIAEDIQQHSQELGSQRVADFQRRLDETRSQHEEIDRKIQSIRLRLDTLRGRLAGIP